jgi:hypothetical protein
MKSLLKTIFCLLAFASILLVDMRALTIEWTTQSGAGADSFSGLINPTQVVVGQHYMIRARGTDTNGNLVAVSINKNGQPFAYAGGGDGYTYISNDPTWDTSPGTATYTAWATSGAGATSDTIELHVAVGAFTIEWTTQSGPGSDPFSGQVNPTQVVVGENYMIRARGTDANGDLVSVCINKNGQPFAYAEAGDGYAYISNNPTWDTAPGTATYTAWATTATGVATTVIELDVKVCGAFKILVNTNSMTASEAVDQQLSQLASDGVWAVTIP